jgi:hypothetical protein
MKGEIKKAHTENRCAFLLPAAVLLPGLVVTALDKTIVVIQGHSLQRYTVAELL